MTRVFDIKSNIPLLSPLDNRGNILSSSGINHVSRVLPDGTTLLTSILVASRAGSIGVDGRTRVVGPERMVDADGVL